MGDRLRYAIAHSRRRCRVQPARARSRAYGSKVRITNVKVFGVSISPNSDRPYVFVKLETNAGLVGWGEGTLEGKAGATMACINDFRDFLIGADPMQWSTTGSRCTCTASTAPVR